MSSAWGSGAANGRFKGQVLVETGDVEYHRGTKETLREPDSGKRREEIQ